MDNPFAAMLFPQQGMGAGMGMGNGAGKAVAPDVSPPTKLQRLMPFVHLVMMWCLLAYFVVWEEPRVYKERLLDGEFGVWRRWAELRTMGPIGITAHVLQVQIVVGCSFRRTSGEGADGFVFVAFLLGFHDVADSVAFSADILRFCA
jgi:hypothetical protein